MPRHTACLIQGDPGSGKSTLVKWLIQQTLKTPRKEPLFGWKEGIVPVPITLRYFAQWIMDGKGESLRDYLAGEAWLESFSVEAEKIGGWVLKQAAEGGAVFFFDGLDEAMDLNLRRKVVQGIDALWREFRHCRFIVTSRVIGYELAPVPETFSVWRLEPFTPAQIRTFFHKWSALMEREEDLPGVDEAGDKFFEARMRKRMQGILDALGIPADENEKSKGKSKAKSSANAVQSSIQRLATNPMLCTLLGLIHHQGRRMPQDRAELYRLCLEAFVYDWEIQKRTRKLDLEALDKIETLDVLEEVAWRLHKDSTDNTITEPELENLIVQFLRENKGQREELARKRADAQIRLIRDRAGLLLERGEKQYGFSHLQFQEYLAGRAMVRRRAEIPGHLKNFVWKTRWQEPIRLAAAYKSQSSEEDATEFIRAVMETPSQEIKTGLLDSCDLEGLLHHAFFLACRCLSDVSRVHFRLRQEIFTLARTLLLDWRRDYLRPHLFGALDSLAEECCLEPLLQQLSDSNPDVRAKAAVAFGQLRSDRVLEPLLKSLKDKVAEVRSRAAWALGLIGGEKAVDSLLLLLRDEDEKVRSNAVYALGRVGGERVVGSLLGLIKNKEGRVGYAAAWALRNLAIPSSVEPLIGMIDDKEWVVQSRAIDVVGDLGDVRAAAQLLGLLKADVYGLGENAAEALGKLGGERVAIELRASLLDKRPFVRRNAVIALGKLADEKAADSLINMLDDADSSVREAAAKELNGLTAPASLEPLRRALHDSALQVRRQAALTLALMGDDSGQQVLLEMSQDSSEYDRGRAAEGLGKVGGEAALEALLKLLEDSHDFPRWRAALALGEFGDEQAVQPIARRLRDKDRFVRARAAAALADLKSPKAIPILVAELRSSERQEEWGNLDSALRRILFDEPKVKG